MNNNNSNQNNDNIHKDWEFSSNSPNSTNNNLNVSNNNDLTNANTNFVNSVHQTNDINSSLNNINSNINQNIIHENNINNEIKIDNSLNTNTKIAEINDYKTNISTKNIVLLVLSIINIMIIVPFVVEFSGFWLIFGALGSKSTYYLLLGGCGIYVIVSIIILIKSIWNVIKYNDVLKKIFKIGILVLFVLIISLFCYIKIYPNSNVNMSNPNSSINNNSNIEMKNNILLNTDDIEIKVKSITYTTNNIELHFILNNKSNKYYNFNVYKLKVNNYENIYFGLDDGSNFRSLNSYVEPHNSSSNYVMYIWYNDLKKYNIEKSEIKKLSFKLLLYTSDKGDTSFNQQNNDNYLEKELK